MTLWPLAGCKEDEFRKDYKSYGVWTCIRFCKGRYKEAGNR